MIGPAIEVIACNAAVTADAVVLRVEVEGDLVLTLIMPRQIGEGMVEAIRLGIEEIKG